MDPDEARKRLEAEKTRVAGLIRSCTPTSTTRPRATTSELSNYDQHPADSATDTFEREKDLGILDDLEAELAEIEAAIERIENGTYGIDEVTGAADRPGPARRGPGGPHQRRHRHARLSVPRSRSHYDPGRTGRHREEHAMGFAIDKLGQWTEGPEFKVEAERTKAYAAATNDPIPAHLSGEVAPPVFAVVPIWDTIAGAMAGVTPPEVLMLVVHGEQDMRLHKPITPGMVLSSKAAPVGIHVKPNGTTVVVKVESRDQTGDLVAEQYMTSFFRGVSDGEGAGEEAPKHKLERRDEGDATRSARSPSRSTWTRPTATPRRPATTCRSTSTRRSRSRSACPGSSSTGSARWRSRPGPRSRRSAAATRHG